MDDNMEGKEEKSKRRRYLEYSLPILAFFLSFLLVYAATYSSTILSNPLTLVSSTNSNNVIEPAPFLVSSTNSNNVIEPAPFLVSSTNSNNVIEPANTLLYSLATNSLPNKIDLLYKAEINMTPYTPPSLSYSVNTSSTWPNGTIHFQVKLSGGTLTADNVRLIIKSPERLIILNTLMNKAAVNDFYYDWTVPSNAPQGYYNVTYQILYSGQVWKTIEYDKAFAVYAQKQPPLLPQEPISVAPTNVTVTNVTNATITNMTKTNMTKIVKEAMKNVTGGGGGGGGGGGFISVVQTIQQQIMRKSTVRMKNPLGISSPVSTAQPGASADQDNVRIIFLGKDRVIYENKECTRFKFRLEELNGTSTIAYLEFSNLSADTTKAVLSDSSRVDVLSGSAIVRVAILPYESVELDVYTPDGPEGSYLAQILRYLRSPAFWDQMVGYMPIWLLVLGIFFLAGYGIYLMMKRSEKKTYRFYRY